jgi:tripartite-type tricarboxylate transporter receptor subunit TctC
MQHRQRTRRKAVCALVCTVVSCMMLPANRVRAQSTPAKTVRLVVPTSPGGGTDFSARMIAPKLSEVLAQAVVVENRAGGGTIIGNELVARAAPNGATLLMGISSLTTIPYLYAKVPYDLEKDLAPISQVVTVPHLLVAHPSLPVRSVRELIAFAKARPGAINYAAGSAGSNPYLAMALFAHRTGIQMVHVPFKGQGPALTDVLGGHTSVMMADILSAMPQVKAGRLRALGVSSAKRASVVPGVPTLAEAGVAGFDVVQWFGVLAPAGTPSEIIVRLHSALVRTLEDPTVRNGFRTAGAEPVGNTPDEFAAVIRSDLRKWGGLIKAAGIKLDGGA